MKIVKEAYTENCKVVFDPDYVTIGHTTGEPIHMSINEAREIVEWLSHELNRVLPEVIQMTAPVEPSKPWVYNPGPTCQPVKQEPVYEPGPRSATQTVEVKVGDPNLAYRHIGGRTAQVGDGAAETIDLGALALKVGKP